MIGIAATLLSIRTGRPRVIDADDPWTTSFFKTPVEGPVRLGRLDLEGDEQADLEVHGGPDKAVCVYSGDHFPRWRAELGLDLECGAFGENFTVAGQSEVDVSIGDIYEIGEALVQVSQPRGPCWKLARRWSRPDLPRRVIKTGRTGWYLRVLNEGIVQSGQTLTLVERPVPQWTIARVNQLAYATDFPAADVAALAACPLLAPGWRRSLARRLSPRSDLETPPEPSP